MNMLTLYFIYKTVCQMFLENVFKQLQFNLKRHKIKGVLLDDGKIVSYDNFLKSIKDKQFKLFIRNSSMKNNNNLTELYGKYLDKNAPNYEAVKNKLPTKKGKGDIYIHAWFDEEENVLYFNVPFSLYSKNTGNFFTGILLDNLSDEILDFEELNIHGYKTIFVKKGSKISYEDIDNIDNITEILNDEKEDITIRFLSYNPFDNVSVTQ